MSDLHDKDALDSFLAHHGVKGMHWGVKRSESGRVQLGAAPRRAHANRVAAAKKVSSAVKGKVDEKKTGHKLNKAARADDKAREARTQARATKSAVDRQTEMRRKYDSGEAKATLKAAKQAHAANKVKLGKYRAKTILDEAKRDFTTTQIEAGRYNYGKDIAKNIVIGVGTMVVLTALNGAARY